MKITNLTKNSQFQLDHNAQLEIERTNPFFNDYGEQSVPMDIPASPHNCQLLGHPEQFGHRGKSQPIDVHIQDGEYSSACRMAVLAAKRNDSISVSFYMNDGSFYSRIQNTRLKDIFGEEKVSGVSTVDQAIAFCRGLINGTDYRFAIFPVLVTDDSGMENQNTYKCINGYGKVVSNQGFQLGAWSGSDFWGAVERNEYVDGKLIRLDKGYYISPFIRANYVLSRVFSHFGYTLESNFFTQTTPFDDMVIVNNVIDTIVNGYIRLADLLPDVSVGDFINLYRKKFCCEFVADEANRSVSVMLFKDVLSSAPAADLSKCLVGHPEFSFNQATDFRRVILKTDETVPSDLEESYDNLGELMKANNAIINMLSTGSICKVGYAPSAFLTTRYTKVAESSMPYDTGEEDIEAEEITTPDCMPEFRTLFNVIVTDGIAQSYENGVWLYVGDYRTLNSKVVLDTTSTEEASEDAPKQNLMLAFTTTRPDGMPVGTVSAYYPLHNADEYILPPVPTYEYALHFHGKYGLFEKFWRDYDNLLRNALQQVKATLLLTQSQKQNLPAHRTVAINGKVFFFDKLRFALGGDTAPMESDLLTTDIEQPATSSPPYTTLQKPTSTYKWQVIWYGEKITKDQYEKAEDKDLSIKTVYPPVPSSAYAGQQYGKQTTSHINPYFSFLPDKNGNTLEYGIYVAETFYLECVPI